MAQMDSRFMSLLEPNTTWNEEKVQLLEQVVRSMYSGCEQSRLAAHELLNRLQDMPDSWRAVDHILQYSKDVATKFYALRILDLFISTKWGIADDEQKQGIKRFIVSLCMTSAKDMELVSKESFYITKLNQTLIQIVKRDWPDGWPNFIPDLVAVSQTDAVICENNLKILQLLSEEVFDFGDDQISAKKVSKLKDTLESQFQIVFTLCSEIFQNYKNNPNSLKPSLVKTTLKTFKRFLRWIPLGFIFQTGLIDNLMQSLWNVEGHRVECVGCLTEIASLKGPEIGPFNSILQRLFEDSLKLLCSEGGRDMSEILQKFHTLIPPQRVYFEDYFGAVAFYLITFYRNHLELLEPNTEPFLKGLNLLVLITDRVPNDETFKLCLDFWGFLAEKTFRDIKRETSENRETAEPLLLGGSLAMTTENKIVAHKKNMLLNPVLHDVRGVLIGHMVKPPEVTIRQDEEGNIVEEFFVDTDEIALHNLMRDTLIYLTNLNPNDMEDICNVYLSSQDETIGETWNPIGLNRLCWAIGSISGSMSEQQEKNFLVTIIRALLILCEAKRGKANKAVVASNIMFVVGQHPRFLRQHWKFLKTVYLKLFEFMHEGFPGVKLMACETFLKIAQKCKSRFVTEQIGEPRPFVEEIIEATQEQISDLAPREIQIFYETLGTIVSAADSPEKIQILISGVMRLPNETLKTTVSSCQQNPDNLRDPDLMRSLVSVIRINNKVAGAVGPMFMNQLTEIFRPLMEFYQAYTSDIDILDTNKYGNSTLRGGRIVQKEILNLMSTVVLKIGKQEKFCAGAADHFISVFLPNLLDSVLSSYRVTRFGAVLGFLSSLFEGLGVRTTPHAARIFDDVFEPTLDLIKSDFQSYPDHRINFYELLKQFSNCCFSAIFTLNDKTVRLFVDSLVWAFKHEQPTIADHGLKVLDNFISQLIQAGPESAKPFLDIYFAPILRDILNVLTDTLHKAGFKEQTSILRNLIRSVEDGLLAETAPKKHVMDLLITMMTGNFPTLNRVQVETFVIDLFNKCRNQNQFSNHTRDFLLQMKEFSGNNDELFIAERESALQRAAEMEQQKRIQVPGLNYESKVTKTDDEVDLFADSKIY
eukprot:GHVL01035939.1.p1 GENE.GHVL01035939.1~~GHVL01035939.1.p1  ORF type:complete len:1099 (-),score=183.72 GHVL01035939.1:1133-4429(-)